MTAMRMLQINLTLMSFAVYMLDINYISKEIDDPFGPPLDRTFSNVICI